MAKHRNIRPAMLPIFLLAAQLLGAGCAATRQPAQKADRDFYRSYSQKLGVSFEGTEDKSLLQASAGWLGVPYRYGGQNRKGIDCSALVGSVYREAYGMTLPRTASAIAKQAKRVKKSDLACGDLLFFTIKDKRASHVGIYLADGKFLHASTSKGVSVADLSNAYWSKYFSGAGRVRTPPPPAKGRQTAQQPIPKQQPVPAAEKKKNVAKKPKAAQKGDSTAEESSSSDVIIVFDEEF